MQLAMRACIALLPLAACGVTDVPGPTGPQQDQPPRIITSLADAANGDWRSDSEKARDKWRNPVETLEFFGVEASDTVAEIWPGGGWYTNVIAPYLASGAGKLIAVHWDIDSAEGERRVRLEEAVRNYQQSYAETELYGEISLSAFSASSAPFAAPESLDVVLTFRNVHNWMAGDYASKFFDDAFTVLKPGGTLGVVEHRLPSSEPQDPRAASGYVHEDYVVSLAELAGFELVASSEVNANPADTADHPFGVWTLPPVLRNTDQNGVQPADFDPGLYQAIGESDRMTLRFTKPVPETDEPVGGNNN